MADQWPLPHLFRLDMRRRGVSGGLSVGSVCTGYSGLDMAALEVFGGREEAQAA